MKTDKKIEIVRIEKEPKKYIKMIPNRKKYGFFWVGWGVVVLTVST